MPWPVCSLRQVCFGAVQRPVLAHVQPGHPGPYLLPSRPLCGAHSVVQRHHEYTLIGKALVLSGSVPSPRNLSPRNLLHSSNTLLPPLETTLQSCTVITSQQAHVISAVFITRVTHRHFSHGPGNFHKQWLSASVMVCAAPNHWATGSFLLLVFKREPEETVSFCTRVCVFSLCLIRAVQPSGWNPLVSYWCMACGLPELHNLGLLRNKNQLKYMIS